MQREEIIIKSGTMYDGTGGHPRKSDIIVEGDRIKFIGEVSTCKGYKVIDASDLVVSPGFVDIHSHSDYYLMIDPLAKSKVHQGVTTEIGGNCGYSAAPVFGVPLEERERLLKEQFDVSHDWSTLPEYFKKLQKKTISINYGHLIGSNTIRASILGYENRKPNPGEIGEMCKIVEQSISEGAFGLSFGIGYSPTCFSEKEELLLLARSVKKMGGIITTHMRSESDELVEAVDEVIWLSWESGVPLQISHLKAMGKSNWHKVKELFLKIEDAISNGKDVTCDRYPYVAANTGLQALLPNYVLEGGKEQTLKRLNDNQERKKIGKLILEKHSDENFWDTIVISQVTKKENKDLEGRSVSKAASIRNKDVMDTFFDLLVDEGLNVDSIFFSMNESNLKKVLKKEYTMVGSDAGAKSIDGPLSKGVPHPRTFGTFPRFLGKYVRDEGLLDMQTAIHKMTGAPCKKLGITDRGLIKENFMADITIFNPVTVNEISTFENPKKYPVGVEYVLVNGSIVIDGGKHTGGRPGRVLKHV